MTTDQSPHLGWHVVNWGLARRFVVHRWEHYTGRFNDGHAWEHREELAELDEGHWWKKDQPAQGAPEELGESAPEAAPLSRWEALAQPARTVALWCVGALAVVVLFDPAPWFLALVIGAAGAALVLQRAAHQRAVAAVAQEIEEERAELAAQKQRAERKEQNRAAHEAERAALYEAARAEREAKRAANREAHRGGETSE